MAEGIVTEPAYVARLMAALQHKLPDAKISHEHLRHDRYRFIVVSDQFHGMEHPERQRIVWNIADSTLENSELLDVAMIITVDPAEL